MVTERVKFWALLLVWMAAGAAWSQDAQQAWFDGVVVRKAWVQADERVVVQEGATPRHLSPGFTVITETGQAPNVVLALLDMGLDATTGLVPDRVYVQLAADRVLAQTLALQALPQVREIRLQWAPRIAAPQ